MNRRGGNWKIFCTWVPHVNNFSPVCMLAKAVYHDKWIKENLRPRAVRQLSKWLSADCSISVDIYQSFSITLCVMASVVAGMRVWLPVWMCWVMSNAETHFPSLLQSLSFSKRKAGYGNSHTCQKWPPPLFSSTAFRVPWKTQAKENSRICFLFVVFCLPCMHTCVCVCEITK